MNRVVLCTKNGHRQYRVDYVGSDGRRHQKFRPTQEEAEDLLAQETVASRQPTRSDLPPTTTLAAYVERWRSLLTRHLKPRTLASYTETLDLHLLPAFGTTRVRDLERGTIKAFLASKLATHQRNSVRIMHATLRVVLNAAIDDGLILANPAARLGKQLALIEAKKVRQERIKAFDRAQRDRFLATAYRVEPWYAPMWEVQVLSGLRPGEAYALHEADFDLDAATARIARTLADDGASTGTPKTEAARDIDLSARAGHVLRAHVTERKAEKLARRWPELPEPFFCSTTGTYPDPRNVRNAFARVVEAAKLPHVTPHGLRHTFASLCLTAGLDVYYVSRMLGHASITETVDTYGKWLPANRKGILDALDGAPQTASVTNL